MNKNFLSHNNEIDFSKIFITILNDKIKILLFTIISFLIGIGYSYQTPNNYKISLNIEPVEVFKLSKVLGVYKLFDEDVEIKDFNLLILEKFINELKDYEELIFYLKDTKKVIENISNLDNENNKRELYKYTKLFKVVPPNKKKNYANLNIIWDNIDEGTKILQDTINLTLNNLKDSISTELNEKLKLEKKLALVKDKERLNYLSEQSSIASELDISDNQVDSVNLSQSNVSLNITTADLAYYLRGYKAIDKEIDLIKSRSYKKFEIINQEIQSLENENIDLIYFNIYSTEIKFLKNTIFILIVSILLGLFIGIIYVLISNMTNIQTSSKKNL